MMIDVPDQMIPLLINSLAEQHRALQILINNIHAQAQAQAPAQAPQAEGEGQAP